MTEPQYPAAQQRVNPMDSQQLPPNPAEATDYTGFSLAAIGAVVGAVITLAAYPMVWFYANADNDATVTGLGKVHNTDSFEITFSSSKLHWLPGATAVVLLVIGVMRLIGKYDAGFNRPVAIVSVLGLAAAAFAALVVSKGFSASVGVYLVLVGSAITAVSALTMAFLRK